jgi:tRNA (guanine26-N2/guanine27-N2)-dimethyltransferase
MLGARQLRLTKPKRPPAAAYANLQHVARCTESGAVWSVPSHQLGGLAASHAAPPGEGSADRESLTVSGPMWVGPMHDESFVARMASAAAEREWADAAALLQTMGDEARAEAHGALLFSHLGDVQRMLTRRGLPLPPLHALVDALRAAGHGASTSHSERKALKTSASLDEVAEVVASMGSP